MKKSLIRIILLTSILLAAPSILLALPAEPVTAAASQPVKAAPAVDPVKVAPPVKIEPVGSEPAPTPAPEEQSWWQSLLVDVIAAALAIFVPVLSALGFLLLRKLGVKVDLETLDNLAGKAALYAEKKAATALKEGKPKSSGAQKEDWAWELVKAIDEKVGASAKGRERLRALILAKIPEAEAAVKSSGKGA
jgi:hypothetical protein